MAFDLDTVAVLVQVLHSGDSVLLPGIRWHGPVLCRQAADDGGVHFVVAVHRNVRLCWHVCPSLGVWQLVRAHRLGCLERQHWPSKHVLDVRDGICTSVRTWCFGSQIDREWVGASCGGNSPTHAIVVGDACCRYLSMPYFVEQVVDTGAALPLYVFAFQMLRWCLARVSMSCDHALCFGLVAYRRYAFVGSTVLAVSFMGGVYAILPAYEVRSLSIVSYLGRCFARFVCFRTCVLGGDGLVSMHDGCFRLTHSAPSMLVPFTAACCCGHLLLRLSGLRFCRCVDELACGSGLRAVDMGASFDVVNAGWL